MITPRHPAVAAAAIAGMLLLYLAGTTFPWRVSQNHARVINTVRVTFPAPGILASRVAPAWFTDINAGREVEITLDVVPLVVARAGQATILAVTDSTAVINLAIAQHGSDLAVRLRRKGSRFARPHYVRGAFAPGRAIRIAVAITATTLSVAVDGDTRLTTSLRNQPLAHWDNSTLLSLGNALNWRHPWLGTVRAARVTTPSATRDLLAPGILHTPTYAERLTARLAEVRPHPSDMALNVFILVPFGFITAGLLGRRRVGATVLIWLPACLAVELAQVVIHIRFPSWLDALLNLTGVIAGALLAQAWRRRRSRVRT